MPDKGLRILSPLRLPFRHGAQLPANARDTELMQAEKSEDGKRLGGFLSAHDPVLGAIVSRGRGFRKGKAGTCWRSRAPSESHQFGNPNSGSPAEQTQLSPIHRIDTYRTISTENEAPKPLGVGPTIIYKLMRPPLLKLIAILLLALQGLVALASGGAMLCTNPDECSLRACIPLLVSSDEPSCEHCGCCGETNDHRAPADTLRPFSGPSGCCVALPPLLPQLRVESDRTSRELDRVLDSTASFVDIAMHVELQAWTTRAAVCAWTHPPPDSPASGVAICLASTRLII